jgi:hypothetical protein
MAPAGFQALQSFFFGCLSSVPGSYGLETLSATTVISRWITNYLFGLKKTMKIQDSYTRVISGPLIPASSGVASLTFMATAWDTWKTFFDVCWIVWQRRLCLGSCDRIAETCRRKFL